MDSKAPILGAIVSSVGSLATGLCCLPIALSTLGTSAALASALGPLGPYFTGLSVLFWATAFYGLYRSDASCRLEGCGNPKRLRRQRVILWIAALIILTTTTLTYWSSWLIYWML